VNALELPGFVDLQVNGYEGVDFSSPSLTAESFVHACRRLGQAGTAAFLPTLITSPLQVYERNLPLMADCMERYELNALGFHLEGPFISAEQGARGVHNPTWVSKPDVSLYDRLQDLARGRIRLITIAAELDGAAPLARRAESKGTAVSLGHQLASSHDIRLLTDAGAVSLTHFGNGIPLHLHRHKNPLWAGLDEERLCAMIITDGHHLPESFVKVVLKVKGVEGIIVVSDSSPLAGLPPGNYDWMGNPVILERNGYLHEQHGPYLAGSSSTMLQCMNHLARLEMLDFKDLVRIGMHNPLGLIDAGIPESNGTALRFEPDNGEFKVVQP
jgi:N-acetylglucosamine-6-phosphate deacetylase